MEKQIYLYIDEVDKRKIISRYHLSDTAIQIFDEVVEQVMNGIDAWIFWDWQDSSTCEMVITLGPRLDVLQAEYCQKVMLTEGYLVDVLAMYLLEKMYREAERVLMEERDSQCGYRIVFPDGDNAFNKAVQIVSHLKQDMVKCPDGVSLVPKKSVACYFKMGKTVGLQTDHICANCDRKDCPNRVQTNLNYGYQRIFGNKNRE